MNMSDTNHEITVLRHHSPLNRICWRWLAALWLVPVMAAGGDEQPPQPPLAPVGPIVFELANQRKFEVIWFHPSLNRRIIGGLARNRPTRYTTPRQTGDRAIVSVCLPGAGPFALWRVSAQISPFDPFPELPGDQFTPLELSIGAARSDLLQENPSFTLGRDHSGGKEPLVSAYPAAIVVDSVFVGLRWKSNSPANPRLGVREGQDQILLQEIGYQTPTGVRWSLSEESYALEFEILDWKPSGRPQALRSSGIRGFEVWYASDSSAGSAGAFSSAMLFSDSLSWQSALARDGYVSLVAIDTQGTVSERKQLRLRRSGFGHLSFSSSSLEFEWKEPEKRVHDLRIQNLEATALRLSLYSEHNRLEISPATINLDGLAVGEVRLSLRKEPRPGEAQKFAVYIHNDRNWVPVKMDALALPAVETSGATNTAVGASNEALPRTFSLSEVYPNPNRGAAKISLNSFVSQSFTVEVYNVLGQVLQTSEIHVMGRREIPVEIESASVLPIAAGIYFVRFSSGSESLMRKFVLLK